MRDYQVGEKTASAARSSEPFELCVVGAGLAGLNALWVASEYLPTGARVVLIDRHSRCGGMWTQTYDFVRLHQPHPYFTVGDIPWDWDKPAHYLATKPEILHHFDHCLTILRSKFFLVELFGYEADLDAATDLAGQKGLRVHCRPSDPQGSARVVDARRFIVARGNGVPDATPLALSSRAVESATPVDMARYLARDEAAPVYVVGSGKTGMDCAQQAIGDHWQRSICMIAGRGTVFFDRSYVAPAGWRRWRDGQLLLKIFGDVAMRFDGTNGDEAFAYFKEKYALSLNGSGENCFFGYLSGEECRMVESGLSEKIDEYLDDVIDSPDGPVMQFRSGRTRPVKPGSIFVNCTGFLLRGASQPAGPISRGGVLLNISSRGSLHFLSSVSAYFLTHLFFSERRSKAPVYAIDTHALFAIDRRAWFMAATTQAFLNPLVLIDALPIRAFHRCGLNTDRLFPLPRIMAVLAETKAKRKKYVVHCRRSLERVARQYGVRCGEIDWC
ncbi:MAG: NAD(P)-binding protein [Sphingomonadales bacterium]|nr:NAD(P)-binding protein [Sphingomonadales bacterium]